MKFAIATKHLHLVVSYRESDDEEGGEFVSNTDGDFAIAPEPRPLPTGDDEPDDLHFGSLRG